MIAVVAGIAIGIPALTFAVRRACGAMPHIEYWRAMPPPALLPISIILLHSGSGTCRRSGFIAFFCLFPVLLNTIDGVRGYRSDLPRDGALLRLSGASSAFGGSRWSRRRSRRSSRGCASCLSLAVIMMVLSEYFSSTSGVGYVLLISKNTFDSAADVGGDRPDRRARLPAELVFLLVERRVLAWHRGWRAATPQ